MVGIRTVTYRTQRGVFVVGYDSKNCRVWRTRKVAAALIAEELKPGNPVTILVGKDGNVERLADGDLTGFPNAQVGNLVSFSAERVALKGPDGREVSYPLTPNTTYFRREDVDLKVVPLPVDATFVFAPENGKQKLVLIRLPIPPKPASGVYVGRGKLLAFSKDQFQYAGKRGTFIMDVSPSVRVQNIRKVTDASDFKIGGPCYVFIRPDGTAAWITFGPPPPAPVPFTVKGRPVEGTLKALSKDRVTLDGGDGQSVEVTLTPDTRFYLREDTDSSAIKVSSDVVVEFRVPQDKSKRPEVIYVRPAD